MALYPQFNQSTIRQLNGRTVKVTGSGHSLPVNKGDLVLIENVNSYRNRIQVSIVSSNHQDAQFSIENKLCYWVSQRVLSLIDTKPDDPPVPEKRPRTTSKMLAELRRTKPCIDYVNQYCINLGYDASAITKEQMELFIAEYNKPDMKKGTINKMVNTYFDSLPKREKINALSPIFKTLDNMLYDQRRSRVFAIEYHKNTIVEFEKQLESEPNGYMRNVYTARISTARKDLELAEGLTNEYVKLADYNQREIAFSQIKRAVCSLINNGTFYTDVEVLNHGSHRLGDLSIVLTTKDIWLQEYENPSAPKINMGSFKVEWWPFAWLSDYDDVPDPDCDDYDEDSDYSMFNFREKLLESVRVLPNKNNIHSEGYIHPHICNGSVCWGNIYDSTIDRLEYNSDLKFLGNIEEAFKGLALLLKTYNAGSPYHKLVHFRIAQNPSYLKLVPVVMEYRGSESIFSVSPEHTAYQQLPKGLTLQDLNKVSIIKYLDANTKTTSPERPDSHAYVKVKLYQKYHQGLNNRPRGESKKYYIKLKDNSFFCLQDNATASLTESTAIVVPF